MKFWPDLFTWGNRTLATVDSWWGSMSVSAQFNDYTNDRKKLKMILSNPAVMKVVSLQCDLFSLGEIYVGVGKGKKEQNLDSDPFLDFVERPNPFQSKNQFLWDFMFFNMIGNAYCLIDSKVITPESKMYFLEPSKIEWPRELENRKDKLVFSSSEVKSIDKLIVKYKYDDGTRLEFPLDRLIRVADLTNGVGNWFKGPSRLDALCKIISNSEHTLDADNINIRYSGKFLVGSDRQVGTTSKPSLTENEIFDISTKMDGDKSVWPLRTMVQIRRFVSDMAALQLDEKYLSQYFLIGNMYGIPRDVLEAYASATYENQEKARMAHVSYCLQPKGNAFMNDFEYFFGYRETGKNIYIDWSHLPFMQVFEEQKSKVEQTKINSLSLLLKEGVPLEEANTFLDTDFSIPTQESVIDTNTDPATLEAQAALRGSVGGVSGILAVQAGVAAGTTTYEAALSIFTIIYGFTDEQARALLGEPQDNGQQETQQQEAQGAAS